MIIKLVIAAIVLFILGLCSIVIFNQTLLFTFFFLLYNNKTMHEPKTYPPASMALYAKSFCKEVFYVLGKYYYLPFKYVNLQIKAPHNSDTAILLVHGYCRSQIDWLWLRKQLKSTNCNIFTLNLMPLLSSIEEITTQNLPAKIAQIKQQTNCKQIILIGHSMGGLVSSYYKEFLDHDKLITAVITIGSPYHGTKISVAAAGINAQEMCPGSEFLARMRQQIATHNQDYYQISSKFDNIVFPWNSALLETMPASRQMVLPFTTHLGLLHSPAVAAQLKQWIAEISERSPR